MFHQLDGDLMENRMSLNRRSAHQLAFDHYLRTGKQLNNAEWWARNERKFNPYHDELGRFSSAPGVTVSYGDQAARMSDQPRSGARPNRPTLTSAFPAGGRVIAEAGARAAEVHRRVAARAVADMPARLTPVRPDVRALLDRIGDGEGVGHDAARNNGFASGYDVPFANGRYARSAKPLTRVTLAEVDDLQKRMHDNPLNSRGSTPVGRYQIRRATLLGLKSRLNLSDRELFDQQMQDRLAVELLRIRGLDDYMGGKISASTFQRNLASEWASVAEPDTGRPRLGNQRLGTTNAQIKPIIDALRNR